jgi:Nucleotidyl transferase AbiEii toxin, Type IV TA system
MAKLASQFVALAPERRTLAFAQTAARMAASSVMVEKDFWVSWLLGLLFADTELAPHLVFKGGTSLSKVYGVIDRFSEDIDLSMSPEFVGADEAAFEAMKSRTRRDAALAQMQLQCGERTRALLMPRLEEAIVEHLGTRKGGAPWLRYEDDPVARSPIVHFEYPSAEAGGFDYLRREVKLELGSLTDQRPTEQHAVRAWVVDDFPAAFTDWNCHVTALELPRTFWEKATILHAEHHRADGQATPDRYARHYSDMARLLGHANAEAMLADHALCARVVEWKSRVFARQWARYDLAKPGTFRLLPPEERLAALARDYAQMGAMFLAAPPQFDAVLEMLGAAERTLNAR